MANLFDKFERTDPTPARHQEGNFAFLNRIATPWWSEIRDRLEVWFQAYSGDAGAEKAADLRGRFRSSDERQHLGAWWELYVYWPGVLFGPGLLPWAVAKVWPQLWLNPNAEYPLDSQLAPLPRVDVTPEGHLQSVDPNEPPARYSA